MESGRCGVAPGLSRYSDSGDVTLSALAGLTSLSWPHVTQLASSLSCVVSPSVLCGLAGWPHITQLASHHSAGLITQLASSLSWPHHSAGLTSLSWPHITQLASHHSAVWCVLSALAGLTSLSCVVCAVLYKPQPDWLTVTVSFSSDNAILTSTRTKEVRCNYETLTTVKTKKNKGGRRGRKKDILELVQRQQAWLAVTSYVVAGPE